MRARDNPFRTERLLAVRYRLGETSWPELLARCEAFRFRGAIIGPHGSGKTTLLEDLALHLQRRGFPTHFLRLDSQQPAFPPGFLSQMKRTLAPETILLLDGAEQLSGPAWCWFRWITRDTGGLIITTHHPGRLPTLWECRTSASLLAGLTAQLLQTEVPLLHERSQTLYHKHRGNIRDALLEWYDICAEAG